ncbi:HK97 family phage portal protein [Pontibacter ummariensis]|uniref:Phage portal protein, HK97 family n=1 Tax=Pontibacter ummariensis TaxID=1610492 RepID=A0A239HKA3_9BACT|nr:phage portal protein [Pontibacter ummariensis]PRY10292.1 HK97 family phage portal protein [Pontibacter ummariensis]SNS81561.1 phage portal protein, HK97 family [Pontibacter ummariensis]
MSVDNASGWFGLFNTSSTVVTEERALTLSTLYSCVKVVAEGVAALPWHTYRNVEKGKDIYRSHPCYNLLHTRPNPFTTSFMFRETMMVCLLLWGNFYAWIERDGANRPVALWMQKPWEVQVLMQDGKLFYKTSAGIIPHYDMIHVAGMGFDGIVGKSPIRLQAEQLGITLNSQKYGADFFKNGATLGGILTNDSGVVYRPEQVEQLKKMWYGDTHGPDNNHKTKILGGGLKYQRIGVPPEEAQFLETRKLGAVEICGMYRVPPHMVGITDKSTSWGSGIEQQDIGFLKYTLLPWLERIKQEFDRKIFRESELGEVYNDFNVNGLLRGDIKSQTEHIQNMMDRGVYSINDALSFLGRNTIGPEGERRLVQRNMVPLDRVDDVITLEQSKKSEQGKKNTK